MSLVKPTYKTQLKTALITALTGNKDIDAAADALAEAIVNATDTYIRSMTITVPLGIPVATAGTQTAQTGATTAPSIAAIS